MTGMAGFLTLLKIILNACLIVLENRKNYQLFGDKNISNFLLYSLTFVLGINSVVPIRFHVSLLIYQF